VVVVVRDARWRSVAPAERQALADELYDGRLQVIDPASGVVLASWIYDGPASELPPFTRFAAGNRAYRVVEDSLGLRSIEVYDIQLVRK
jgi:hypothetical protein